jgi:hypothetical protein
VTTDSYRGEHLGDVVVWMGQTQQFNCHIGTATMFAQIGVLPDFASAIAASSPEQ